MEDKVYKSKEEFISYIEKEKGYLFNEKDSTDIELKFSDKRGSGIIYKYT